MNVDEIKSAPHSVLVQRLRQIEARMTVMAGQTRMSATDDAEADALGAEAEAINAQRLRLERADDLARTHGAGAGLRTVGGAEGTYLTDGSLPVVVDDDASPAARAAALTAGSTDWATRAASLIGRVHGETRAVVSGSIDTPSLIAVDVVAKPRPRRLIDLLVTRQSISGNAYEYFRQSVRTNNAAPVADNALKPTSIFTVQAVEDRARVIAHLSEAIPLRLLADHKALQRWLNSEMVEGVLDALEAQVISGSGTGENMSGILTVSGTTQVAFATDVVTTLRKGLTALQTIGVQPNAWVLHPADAEAVDLAKEGTGGIGFLTDGYTQGNALSGNIFGDPAIQRVVSPSVPVGTAVLGDWSKVGLWIREGVRIDIDAGGVLFTQNQAVLRAEARVGVGVLVPPAFAEIDLTP